MATEPNKSVILRPVKNAPALSSKEAKNTGIIFECLAAICCPHCKASVPLAEAKPLSHLVCPTCGKNMLVPGRVGGFLLYEHIGEGEMGAIYRATDESLKRDVAVKLVRGCHAEDPESLERLHLEACAAGKLNHPRVAQVYALNFSNGHPYLVMELVTGQDFAQKLESEGRIDERTVLRMALDVADGLSALNREGLVHGDIKPANIVLDRDGNAKLVDFGLSGMTRLDDRGNLVGTPNYIAPELLRGAEDTHRSDIYSLGATLYHLLSGRLTHDGSTPADVLKARLSQQPVPLGKHARHVSLSTQKLIMRMLDLNPEKRPASSDVVAAEIRDALARLDSTPPATAPRPSGLAQRLFARLKLPFRIQPSTPQSRRRAFAVGLLGLGLVAALEFLVAVREQTFDWSLDWLRFESAGHKKVSVQPPVTQAMPDPAALARDVFTTEDNLIWQSMNLGGHTQRGSTMHMGGTMIVQGTGTDMWKGYDHCRFVWTKASGDYAFSAQVKSIADINPFAITGLLIKGENPAFGPGLLFGLLGNGELFLQVRQQSNKTVVVKRSGQPIRLPSYLKLSRRGKAFEACISVDGRTWDPFAACELDLPAGNTVGFSVSAQDPNALATAKFSGIRLLISGLSGAAQTNKVSSSGQGGH